METSGAALLSGGQHQPPAAAQHLLLHSLLRATLLAILLVVLYYLIPLDQPLDVGTATHLLIGLVVIAGEFAWQLCAIIDSDHPRLRAIEALATSLPLFLLFFSFTYCLIARNQVNSFSEPLSRTDALYFTITVFATVGFGDITPKSDVARIVTMAQMILDIVVIGVIAKLMLGAVRRSLQRRPARRDPPRLRTTLNHRRRTSQHRRRLG